eukprot:scaffold447571_cov50-Prasinocladus_malaysianus.AAC.1
MASHDSGYMSDHYRLATTLDSAHPFLRPSAASQGDLRDPTRTVRLTARTRLTQYPIRSWRLAVLGSLGGRWSRHVLWRYLLQAVVFLAVAPSTRRVYDVGSQRPIAFYHCHHYLAATRR